MGGTDDPSNLVNLTVKEHAEAHRTLFEQHGKKEDYVAWKSLSAQIGKEQLLIELSSIGGLNNRGKQLSEEHKKNLAKALSLETYGPRRPHSIQTKQAISKNMIGNTNSSNHCSLDYKKKQSEAMKLAWAKRKAKLSYPGT